MTTKTGLCISYIGSRVISATFTEVAPLATWEQVSTHAEFTSITQSALLPWSEIHYVCVVPAIRTVCPIARALRAVLVSGTIEWRTWLTSTTSWTSSAWALPYKCLQFTVLTAQLDSSALHAEITSRARMTNGIGTWLTRWRTFSTYVASCTESTIIKSGNSHWVTEVARCTGRTSSLA